MLLDIYEASQSTHGNYSNDSIKSIDNLDEGLFDLVGYWFEPTPIGYGSINSWFNMHTKLNLLQNLFHSIFLSRWSFWVFRLRCLSRPVKNGNNMPLIFQSFNRTEFLRPFLSKLIFLNQLNWFNHPSRLSLPAYTHQMEILSFVFVCPVSSYPLRS